MNEQRVRSLCWSCVQEWTPNAVVAECGAAAAWPCERCGRPAVRYRLFFTKSTALIPHPREYYGGFDTELTNERMAMRIACAFDDGWYKAMEYLFNPSGSIGGRWRLMNSVHKQCRPSYTDIRDFLRGEFNAPTVLAARVALWHTRHDAELRA